MGGMSIFKKRNTEGAEGSKPLAKIPIIGELFEIGPLIPKIAELFQNKNGRMSSKRMGAGAFVVAGIALVNAGAAEGNKMQFWGGIALCGMGVVLFALTRWDGGRDDDDPGSPEAPTVAAS
ncbi:MAG: hypothetical protein JST38_16620 [Bacteroidetes bacterium]|nr:hypothetical protein [Bacteroidota bacterium]